MTDFTVVEGEVAMVVVTITDGELGADLFVVLTTQDLPNQAVGKRRGAWVEGTKVRWVWSK